VLKEKATLFNTTEISKLRGSAAGIFTCLPCCINECAADKFFKLNSLYHKLIGLKHILPLDPNPGLDGCEDVFG
jgi:hypothetical protein